MSKEARGGRFEFFGIGAGVALLGSDSEPWVRFRLPITSAHYRESEMVNWWLVFGLCECL